jgi:hypothetical protein
MLKTGALPEGLICQTIIELNHGPTKKSVNSRKSYAPISAWLIPAEMNAPWQTGLHQGAGDRRASA